MELIDIGANLGHDSFDHDRAAVLQRARDAGVAQLVVTGASRAGSPEALALARAHPGLLFATAGPMRPAKPRITAMKSACASRWCRNSGFGVAFAARSAAISSWRSKALRCAGRGEKSRK